MDELSATEAARRFSDLLDDVEHRGKSFVVTRHGRAVARVEPVAGRSTGADLLAFLRVNPPDSDWLDELRELRSAYPAEAERWSR